MFGGCGNCFAIRRGSRLNIGYVTAATFFQSIFYQRPVMRVPWLAIFAAVSVSLAAGESEADAAVAKPEKVAAAVAEDLETAPAVARPVNADPVQIFGWREWVFIDGGEFLAKLDTGAHTSSIHAENQVMFERDGDKWVRFEVLRKKGSEPRKVRLEAPLVRTTLIKRPGAESELRNVVKLSYRVGDRQVRGEFTLNDRGNMIAPVLIGRSGLKVLGWVDSERKFLAERKIFR